MPEEKDNSYNYNYKIWTYLHLLIYFPFFSFWVFCLIYSILNKFSPGILMSLFIGISQIFYLQNILARMPIHVDDAGIEVIVFGLFRKKIKWENVIKVKKIRIIMAYGGNWDVLNIYEKNYNLLCSYFVNLYGPITFCHIIRNFDDLVSKINYYADRHNVPLYFWDQTCENGVPNRIGEPPLRKKDGIQVSEFQI